MTNVYTQMMDIAEGTFVLKEIGQGSIKSRVLKCCVAKISPSKCVDRLLVTFTYSLSYNNMDDYDEQTFTESISKHEYLLVI